MAVVPSATMLSDVLPVLFLEARVHGDARHLITQMGVSVDSDQFSVGMFTRTSGVLLVAGFGGYCAYRFANRLLDRSFVCALFDGARCDLLNRADTRLLTVDAKARSEVDRVRSPASLMSIEPDDDDDVASTSSQPPGGQLKVLKGSRLARTLESLRSSHGLAGIVDDSPCTSVASSSVVSRRRTTSPPRRKTTIVSRIPVTSLDLPDDDDLDDSASVIRSETSEIRLVWDGDLDWDDEMPTTSYGPGGHGPGPRSQSPAFSDISNLSAFKKLKSMFESQEADLLASEAGSVVSEAVDDLTHAIREKCLVNSNYMYRSVVVQDATNSDGLSVCSGRSGFSGISLLRDKRHQSHGLWEVASSHLTPEKTHIFVLEPPPANPMTDSGVSGLSAAQSSTAMHDSTFDTGFLSSDDEGTRSRHGGSSSRVPSVAARRPLDKIKEQPSPAHHHHRQRQTSGSGSSNKSLEWCYDDLS